MAVLLGRSISSRERPNRITGPAVRFTTTVNGDDSRRKETAMAIFSKHAPTPTAVQNSTQMPNIIALAVGFSIWLAVALLGLLIAAAAHAADPPCGTHADVIKTFADKYKETQKALALTNRGTLLEVLISGDGSTWTIIVSIPHGPTCAIMAGEAWQPTEKPTGGGI
jgi:hypothetical protein